MLPCGSTALDYLEANKENIPLSQLIEKARLVLPSVKDEEIDVVSVTESPSEVLLTPCMSQSSHTSTMSPAATSADELDGESDDFDQENCENGENKNSRKEKSLGLLCQRFLIAMNEETRNSVTNEVHLESVAKKMNVEKRRIYDIVNVMEALDAMNKTNKSFYRWHGLQDLPKLMHELQKEAAVERLPERVLRVEQAMCSFSEIPGRRVDITGIEQKPFAESTSSAIRTRVESRDRQGRNSLAQLCRRFLMVLLSNPKSSRRVSLDVASTVLIKDPETEGYEPPSRSRCRRLYDIANVLVALGLIKKVHYQFGTKKIPLFVYCGPEPDEHGKYDANACLEKILTSSAPQTPLMKATTAAMVHSLSLGKRSQSDANLARTTEDAMKMPRMRSDNLVHAASSSLMMFAELAAERLRIESQKANDGIAKPQPQFPMTASPFHVSPLGLTGIVLPPRPMWNPVAPSSIMSSPLTSRPPVPQPKPSPKHSVSHILGNRTNNLDHKQSSAFQVVKKMPFAALHNLSNSSRP